jgi:hypothetical protein
MGKVFTEEMAQRYSDLSKFDVIIRHSKVVGTTFRPQDHIELVQTGDFLVILPEIGNPHDEFACRVMHDITGNHVGYISRDISREVWENATNGDLYVAKAEVTGEQFENKGLNLMIRHLKRKAQ